MAAWTKRTTKSPTRGIRQTKTNSYGGKSGSKSTTSLSYKSGSTRVTRSVSSDGKLRKTITEHRPNGFSRRTTQTLVPANKPKKTTTAKPKTEFSHKPKIKKSVFPKLRKTKITTKTRNSSTRSRNFNSETYTTHNAELNNPGVLLLICILIAFLILFSYSVKAGLFTLIGFIVTIIVVYVWPESKPKDEEVVVEKNNSWKWWTLVCVSVWCLNYVFLM